MLKEAYLMVADKSLDVYKVVISALLRDAHEAFGGVLTNRALRLTTQKVMQRISSEGVGFLTKALPRLGKYFDQALAGEHKFDPSSLGWKAISGSKLPRFLGELFGLVFSHEGDLLHDPDANCVSCVRDILYCFYKYEIPYTEDQEQQVISAFKSAEEDLSKLDHSISSWSANFHDNCVNRRRTTRHQRALRNYSKSPAESVDYEIFDTIREARILLSKILGSLDIYSIVPRHGPGVVATKQRHEAKYEWTNISRNIAAVYPIDAYFYASLGHFTDDYNRFSAATEEDLPAQVLLVPKDSRGPRLISCEPVDYQWVQQGLRAEIYRLVESNPLTKGRVNFTDQEVNRRLAQKASLTGDFATLDLKEASDRVHLELVRLLFPEHLVRALECCRSSSTILPDGTTLKLRKFAPMGSALCFPVLALTIWALSCCAVSDVDAKSVYVYGDDVIVPSTCVESVMTQLERFGLLINRSKSCTKGLFRESCGMDAFNGVDVTPVRLRTAWESVPSPSVYSSWIAYSNHYYSKRRYHTASVLADMVIGLYGPVPVYECNNSYPGLMVPTTCSSQIKRRWNPNLQRLEFRVRVVRSVSKRRPTRGWIRLLRYFTEFCVSSLRESLRGNHVFGLRRPYMPSFEGVSPVDTSAYTKRHASKLVWCWR